MADDRQFKDQNLAFQSKYKAGPGRFGYPDLELDKDETQKLEAVQLKSAAA